MTKQQLSEMMIDFMAARIPDIEYKHLIEVLAAINQYLEENK
jgi:hypothetical protein